MLVAELLCTEEGRTAQTDCHQNSSYASAVSSNNFPGQRKMLCNVHINSYLMLKSFFFFGGGFLQKAQSVNCTTVPSQATADAEYMILTTFECAMQAPPPHVLPSPGPAPAAAPASVPAATVLPAPKGPPPQRPPTPGMGDQGAPSVPPPSKPPPGPGPEPNMHEPPAQPPPPPPSLAPPPAPGPGPKRPPNTLGGPGGVRPAGPPPPPNEAPPVPWIRKFLMP